MKKIFVHIIFLLSTLTVLANCSNDSTVIRFVAIKSYNGPSKQVKIETYHLDLGTVDQCISQNTGNNPFGPFSCNTSYYTSVSKTFDGNGALTDKFIRTGSATGWVNNMIVHYGRDASGNIIEEYHLGWNGTGWDTMYIRKKIFNAGLLTEEYTLHGTGGALSNFYRYTINYNGNIPTDKIFQHGNGNTWVNDSQFVNIFSGNTRDSLKFYNWNAGNNNWLLEKTFPYSGNTFVSIIRLTPVTVPSGNTADTVRYDLDTLDRIIQYSNFTSQTIDTVNFELFGYLFRYNYTYFNDSAYQTKAYGGTVFNNYSVGDENPDCSDFSYTYYYDANGNEIQMDDNTRCGMPNWGYDYFNYDADGFFRNEHYVFTSMTADFSRDINCDHADSSSIIAKIPSWYYNMHLCKSSSFQFGMYPIGGCPPYHYQWTPSTNLSSDTVSNPFITVADSISYSVNVTDAAGHSTLISYDVAADYPTLTVDTTNPLYIGILSTQLSGPYYYNWYLNNSPIQFAHNNTYNATIPGAYFLIMHNATYNCDISSDTIVLPLINSISSPEFSQTGLKYYPNPVSNQLTVELTNKKTASQYFLYDVFDKLILSGNLQAGTNIINLENLSEGIYYFDSINGKFKVVKISEK